MIDYEQYLSTLSKSRREPVIRGLLPYANRKGIIPFFAGQPNPNTFPYASMSLTLATGEVLTVDPDLFRRSMMYDVTSGLPNLRDWLHELQVREHHPPCKDFDVSVGPGSQDLLAKMFEMFGEPDSAFLVESPTYTGALSILEALQVDLVPVPTDAHGIMPSSLEDLLENWPASNPSGKTNQPLPRILYTIPVGGNPTGVSSTFERKKEMYKVCQKYGIIIIEDDPYYYLQFDKIRTPSYLSIDVDGRVLRLDSMSKILSAGLRVGWVTGPKRLVERINVHTMATNLQTSGISQLMAYTLLDKWGYDQFYEHVRGVADFYREKRDIFVKCLDKHLTGLAEWVVPDSGMFVWIRLLGGVKDSYDLVFTRAMEKNVLALPGLAFMPDKATNEYIRVSYSCTTPEQMDEGCSRLALVVKEEIESHKENKGPIDNVIERKQ